MELKDKVIHLPTICGIQIDVTAEYLPAAGSASQPFTNTFIAQSEAEEIYFGKGSVSFSEKGKDTVAGMRYEQKLRISIPNGDVASAERINGYRNAKFIYIKLSGGKVLLLGRNDYFQNTRLKISVTSNHSKTTITYSTSAITPTGIAVFSGSYNPIGTFPLHFITL